MFCADAPLTRKHSVMGWYVPNQSRKNIVAEGGNKTAGASAAAPVKIVPVKVEYGSRVTDEFMYASEERQIDILGAFMEGYARKIARGLDIMGFHGVNPRDKAASTLIGTNSLDTNTGVTTVTYTTGSEFTNLKAAVAAIGDADLTGYALLRARSPRRRDVSLRCPFLPENKFDRSYGFPEASKRI